MRIKRLFSYELLRLSAWLAGGMVVFFIFSDISWARTKEPSPEQSGLTAGFKPTATRPNVQYRVHRVGNIATTVTNRGYFGSFSRGFKESPGGCFMAIPTIEGDAPSFEFPIGSSLDYLFQGALWVGALVDTAGDADPETLVSMGHDGWFSICHFYPDSPPEGAIIEKSSRRSAERCYLQIEKFEDLNYNYRWDPGEPFEDVNGNGVWDQGAQSEQDIIAEFNDTITDQGRVTCSIDWANNKHVPLNAFITQTSYAWSYDYAADFILLDYRIINGDTTMGVKKENLRKWDNMYMAVYIDADVGYYPGIDFQDDICGFKLWVPSPFKDQFGNPFQDTINIAWIADIDGSPEGGVFGPKSPVAVTGTRVVRSPDPNLQFSFNWWISQGDPTLDFGPWLKENRNRRPSLYDGVWGTPQDDLNKYFTMANDEFDYDQIWSNISTPRRDYKGREFVVCKDISSLCPTYADGYDTRYLLSFGPIDADPGDTFYITLGYIAGDNFHTKPTNWADNMASGKSSDSSNVQKFYDNLSFEDFSVNAQWAAWVFDNPGVDTDSLTDPIHYKGKFRIIEGDTVYYEGDGVPDFQGPPPPTPPALKFDTEQGTVTVRWNGKVTETEKDPFSGLTDFEGYRIYWSYTGRSDDYTLLASYDKLDYTLWQFDSLKVRWNIKEASLSAAEILALDSVITDPPVYTRLNPYLYTGTDTVTLGSTKIAPGDKLYFEKQGYNIGLDDIKTYPAVTDTSDSRYYDYFYRIENILPSQPVYLSVTASDFGNPKTNLGPLEGSPLVSAKLVYAADTPDKVLEKNARVVVYPNPYKISESYVKIGVAGWEPGTGDRDKRINFLNLPAECIIRIYTLDGDLVDHIEHYKSPDDPDATHNVWDLISSNDQAVVSGIYIYTVEPVGISKAHKPQVGKIVIIK